MRRKIGLLGIVLFCAAGIAGIANAADIVRTSGTPSTRCTDNFFVKEGDIYRMAHNQCPKSQDAESICVAAATLAPGSLLVWPAKDSPEPPFRALTYAGIQDDEIVLTRDPGPSLRLPIQGIFTKYGILDIAGYRIILDIVHPDKVQAKVRHAARRCRCR